MHSKSKYPALIYQNNCICDNVSPTSIKYVLLKMLVEKICYRWMNCSLSLSWMVCFPCWKNKAKHLCSYCYDWLKTPVHQCTLYTTRSPFIIAAFIRGVLYMKYMKRKRNNIRKENALSNSSVLILKSSSKPSSVNLCFIDLM